MAWPLCQKLLLLRGRARRTMVARSVPLHSRGEGRLGDEKTLRITGHADAGGCAIRIGAAEQAGHRTAVRPLLWRHLAQRRVELHARRERPRRTRGDLLSHQARAGLAIVGYG